MNRQDARQVAEVLDEVIRNRRGASIFAGGEGGPPTNLGIIWMREIMSMERPDVAARAVADLFSMAPERHLNPSDLRAAYRKRMRDEQVAALPALPAADDMPSFVRTPPTWVKGKIVALANSDTRAWPEQQPGYDELQRENPYDRSYVWSEQQMIDPEARARYEEIGARLTTDQFASTLAAVVGSGAVPNADNNETEDYSHLLGDA